MTDATECYLGIDIGSISTKGVIIDADRHHRAHVPVDRGQPGRRRAARGGRPGLAG